MKRIIAYVVLIIGLITLGIVGYNNKPLERPKEEILGVTYYKYNSSTNDYDEFMIDNNEISYTGNDYELEGCKSYTYDTNSGIIKLDCNKELRINEEAENVILLETNEIRNLFYSEKESSYNYEFQKEFGTTESVYKSRGEASLKDIEIDIDELKELMDEKTINFVYIKSNSCDTSCTIFNNTFKNFSKDENIYYLNLDNITQDDIDDIYEDYETFPTTLNELKKNYPQVLVIKNGILEETLKIEINGFDASKYENYAKNYGEDENENN